MPSETNTEVRKLAKPGAPPPEQEHLPCPRCDSTNTKFCYYNNYNFSQPRHFCKSCRRYWTHGGTLRDIPVGGGTRKNAKRSRSCASPALLGSSLAATSAQESLPLAATPVLLPLAANQGVQFGDHGKRSNAGGGTDGATAVCGNFTSLLNTQGPGFLALGGFGLGIGPGFDDIGFGLGRGMWAFPAIGDGGAPSGGGNGALATAGLGGSWQFESGENGFVGGDCFHWPELAISTPGNGLK